MVVTRVLPFTITLCTAIPDNTQHCASDATKQLQHPFYVRVIKFAFRFPARQHQFHQVVIAKLKKARKSIHVGVAEVLPVAIEKTPENDVVFKQSASRAPAQACAAHRIGLTCIRDIQGIQDICVPVKSSFRL